jgi:hypothetical protein
VQVDEEKTLDTDVCVGLRVVLALVRVSVAVARLAFVWVVLSVWPPFLLSEAIGTFGTIGASRIVLTLAT